MFFSLFILKDHEDTSFIQKCGKKNNTSRRQRKNGKIYVNLTLHSTFFLLRHVLLCVCVKRQLLKKKNLNLFHSFKGVK